MSAVLSRLKKRLHRLEQAKKKKADLAQYRNDPVGYAKDVLGITLWEGQKRAARLLLEPPWKVQVKASHSVGKTHLAAVLTSWFFFTRPNNSAVITTAPTLREVRDLLWTEVRMQSRRARIDLPNLFIGRTAPEMRSSEDHFAKGFTAAKDVSFQGRHFKHMMFVFDEAVGVRHEFWEVMKSMFVPGGEHFWLCIYNPTDTASQAYAECFAVGFGGAPAWNVISLSSLDHPNLKASLSGTPMPYPSAVSREQFEGWLADWAEEVPETSVEPDRDFEWPPGSGKWYRPGPLMESRALGRWPSAGTYGVWSDALWALACEKITPNYPNNELPVIGCDIAFQGDDFTEMHVKWGKYSRHHERHNGWLEDRTAGRLKQLCSEWADRANDARPPQAAKIKPQDIPVHYDGDGRGGGLTTHKGDYKFIPICASSTAYETSRYPNRRSELWFNVALMTRKRLVNLSFLPADMRERLRRQAMAPTWSVNAQGCCVVEPKDKTKARLKHSPDGMDAVNLAYAPAVEFEAPSSAPAAERKPPEQPFRLDGNSARPSRLFGR